MSQQERHTSPSHLAANWSRPAKSESTAHKMESECRAEKWREARVSFCLRHVAERRHPRIGALRAAHPSGIAIIQRDLACSCSTAGGANHPQQLHASTLYDVMPPRAQRVGWREARVSRSLRHAAEAPHRKLARSARGEEPPARGGGAAPQVGSLRESFGPPQGHSCSHVSRELAVPARSVLLPQIGRAAAHAPLYRARLVLRCASQLRCSPRATAPRIGLHWAAASAPRRERGASRCRFAARRSPPSHSRRSGGTTNRHAVPPSGRRHSPFTRNTTQANP